ncbi:putative membrane protein [Rhodococcus sp. OAS809]
MTHSFVDIASDNMGRTDARDHTRCVVADRAGSPNHMSTVTESIDVNVPLRTVYDQWTQFESFPHFMSGVREIRQTDDVHTHWTVEIAGQVREFDATITEQHPDERVAWKSDAGPNHAGVITFHRLDDSHTRVTAQMDIDPDGFVENVADKFGILTHRVKNDMKNFKEFIESRGHETGAWRGNIERPEQIRPDET